MAQPKETAGSKIVKQISMQEFLETQSLYTKTDVAVPTLIHNLFPEVLVLHCEICNDTRPFRYPFSRGSGAGHMPEQVEHAGIYSCHVRCTGCQQQSFTCWVRVSLTPKTWVEKVGQYPSVASLSLQRHLKNMLFYHKGLQVHKTPLPFVAYARKTAILRGQIWSARKSGVVGLYSAEIKRYRKVLAPEDYNDLRRAVGLSAHGIGIGAFVYLRRIFERLIEEAHQTARQASAWDEERFQQSRMPEKIGLLALYLPSFLVENKSLYGILSKGLHELSEDECLQYFSIVQHGIELILEERITTKEKNEKIAQTKKDIALLTQRIKEQST